MPFEGTDYTPDQYRRRDDSIRSLPWFTGQRADRLDFAPGDWRPWEVLVGMPARLGLSAQLQESQAAETALKERHLERERRKTKIRDLINFLLKGPAPKPFDLGPMDVPPGLLKMQGRQNTYPT